MELKRVKTKKKNQETDGYGRDRKKLKRGNSLTISET